MNKYLFMQSEGGVKGVVLERIRLLFSFAEKEAKNKPEKSRRYISLARRLATRFRLRLPKEFKRRFCKKCNTYWIPGFNVKVRLKPAEKRIIYACECGAKSTFPYKSTCKKKEKG